MSLVVFLDLDRTLYNTDLGGQLIWQKVASLYPQIDGEVELANQQNFYDHNGDLYAYDFSAHLRSLGLEPAEVYRKLKQSELADGRLEYEGADELVGWIKSSGEARVLTYGVDDYQRLKAALCPSIKGLQVITTRQPKGDYFRQTKLSGAIWMVDDKPIGSELPEGVRFIQVEHGGQGVDRSNQWPAVSGLAKVQDILQKST